MTWLHFFDWTGSGLGLTGAFLLATNTRVSRFGWIAFLAANFAMIAFALCVGAQGVDAHGLLLQQVGFVGTSSLGLYRTWLQPWRAARARAPAKAS
jgi:hypothetical protein